MIFVNGGTTMRIRFGYVTNLEYEVKALRAKVEAYESGEIYRRQKDECEKKLREKDRMAAARLETVTVRRNWQQVFDDMEKEQEKALSREQKRTAMNPGRSSGNRSW